MFLRGGGGQKSSFPRPMGGGCTFSYCTLLIPVILLKYLYIIIQLKKLNIYSKFRKRHFKNSLGVSEVLALG